MDNVCLKGVHFRAEDELLLACASASAGREQRETLRRLARECKDWDYVLEAVRYHGIAAMVSSNLDQAAADIAPPEHLTALRHRFRANASRNLFLTQELLSLIRKFGAEGIDVIPFKGPLLAITAYGNIALREFRDLDILVPKQHLNRAGQLLIQYGYEQPADQAEGGGSSHVESQLGCDFFRKDGRVSVELHWSFIQRWLGFEVDLAALWKAPERINAGGMSVRTLPAEIALLYLCAHGAKHRWNRLCRVVDVAQQLRAQPAVDWEGLLITAKLTGSRRTLFLGLQLAHLLFGADFPAEVWTQMNKDAAAQALARDICGSLFSSAIQTAPKGSDLRADWFYLRTKERWQDRLRYLRYSAAWFLLPSQKDREWVRLPAGLGWLYIFMRPLRVACTLVAPRSGKRC